MAEPALIFFHIPKTGGTTLAAALGDHLGDHQKIVEVNSPAQAERTKAHLDEMSDADRGALNFLSGHFVGAACAGRFEGRTITVVRDPIDQTVSNWFFHKKRHAAEFGVEARLDGISSITELFDAQPRFRNLQLQRLVDNLEFGQKADGFADETRIDSLLARIDFVGVTDQLDLFIYLIRKELALETSLYPARNVGHGRKFGPTPDEISTIERECAQDRLLYERAKQRFARFVYRCFSENPRWEKDWQSVRSRLQTAGAATSANKFADSVDRKFDMAAK